MLSSRKKSTNPPKIELSHILTANNTRNHELNANTINVLSGATSSLRARDDHESASATAFSSSAMNSPGPDSRNGGTKKKTFKLKQMCSNKNYFSNTILPTTG